MCPRWENFRRELDKIDKIDKIEDMVIYIQGLLLERNIRKAGCDCRAAPIVPLTAKGCSIITVNHNFPTITS